MSRWIVVFLLVFAIGIFAAIAGTDKTTNSTQGKKAAADEDLYYLRVSGDLARIASGTKDAILMLAAARLEAMASTEGVSRDKASDGEQESADPEPKPEKGDLYALAKGFAGTNEALHTVIEGSQSSAATMKGRTGGAAVTQSYVDAHSTDIYQIEFRGGRLAEVSVIGDGDTDLDLYVYDEYGNLIDSDTDATDTTYCSWTPAWTGSFRIEIKNLGSVYNNYQISTN